MKRRWLVSVGAAVGLALTLAGCSSSSSPPTAASKGKAAALAAAPSSPPTGTQLCNGGSDSGLLSGPASAPAAWSASTAYSYSATAPVFVVYTGNLYVLTASTAAGIAPTGSASNNASWQYVNPASSTTAAGSLTPTNGVITVPAGDDTPYLEQPAFFGSTNTVFYFQTGVHTIGTGQFDQLPAKSGDTFLGAPGAILNGQGVNQYAIPGADGVGNDPNVVIEYLTIEGFVPGGDSMAINVQNNAHWLVQFNTLTGNTGAAVNIGSSGIVNENCLGANDQYGFQSEGGDTNVTLTNNDIDANDTNGTWDQTVDVTSYSVTSNVATVHTTTFNTTVGHGVVIGGSCNSCSNIPAPGAALNGTQTVTSVLSPTAFTFNITTPNVATQTCSSPCGTVSSTQTAEGASGGGKFWQTAGGTVTGNWVHDNGGPGLWADTDNSGLNISGNYIAHNWAEAIIYEASYNASITNNGIVDNAWGQGPSPTVGGFPDAAVYISESGSDSRVAGAYGTSFSISNNVFVDNWGGVVAYENSNRACGLSNDNLCTLVDPATYTLTSCGNNLPGALTTATPDYADNCRWKTQNLSVTGNVFDITPSNIGPGCTSANLCGDNGLFSEPGTQPSSTRTKAWPSGASYPYAGYTVPNNISNNQHNAFSANTYCGSWGFVGFAQGVSMSQAQWTGGVSDVQSGGTDTGHGFGAQDSGSTFSSSACSSPPPTTTTTTSATTTTTSPPPTTTTTSTTTTSTTTTTLPPPPSGFTYTKPSPPVITSVTPRSGSTNGSTPVVIVGTGFSGATSVHFGATPATHLVVVSDTEITCFAPAGTGMVNVTVTTPAGIS